MKLEYSTYTLNTHHPFGISRSTFSSYDRVYLFISKDGITGRGEAAPSPRYNEDTKSILNHLKKGVALPSIITCSDEIHEISKDLAGGISSLEAAYSMAFLDWLGQKEGKAVYEYLGGTNKLPLTSFTIAIGDLESIPKKIREAEKYPILKVKLGTPNDKEIILKIRELTEKPLRIDANEGWDLHRAIEMSDWLSDKNVEFIEQPLPADQLENIRNLKGESPLKIFADENSINSNSVKDLQGVYHGINIKLSKCGSLFEAKKMVDLAKKYELETMLGCMIESSIGITAAGHLASQVDYVDLDGNLLISNDPYIGVKEVDGQLSFDEPITGLGITKHDYISKDLTGLL